MPTASRPDSIVAPPRVKLAWSCWAWLCALKPLLPARMRYAGSPAPSAEEAAMRAPSGSSPMPAFEKRVAEAPPARAARVGTGAPPRVSSSFAARPNASATTAAATNVLADGNLRCVRTAPPAPSCGNVLRMANPSVLEPLARHRAASSACGHRPLFELAPVVRAPVDYRPSPVGFATQFWRSEASKSGQTGPTVPRADVTAWRVASPLWAVSNVTRAGAVTALSREAPPRLSRPGVAGLSRSSQARASSAAPG